MAESLGLVLSLGVTQGDLDCVNQKEGLLSQVEATVTWALYDGKEQQQRWQRSAPHGTPSVVYDKGGFLLSSMTQGGLDTKLWLPGRDALQRLSTQKLQGWGGGRTIKNTDFGGHAVLGLDQLRALNVSLNLWEPQFPIYKKREAYEAVVMRSCL